MEVRQLARVDVNAARTPWSPPCLSSPPIGSGASGSARWPSWWPSTPPLGLAGSLAEVLRERNLLPASLLFILFLLVAAIVGSGLKRRPGRHEVWVALGITAVYGLAVLRMSGSPEERTHLFEYGIVAVLIYHALSERLQNGRRVRAPAALALVVTVPVGLARRGHPGASAQPRLRQL